jgi:hypothetical protein
MPLTHLRKVLRPKSLISTWLTCGMTTSMGDSAVCIVLQRIEFVQDAINRAATGWSRKNDQPGSGQTSPAACSSPSSALWNLEAKATSRPGYGAICCHKVQNS